MIVAKKLFWVNSYKGDRLVGTPCRRGRGRRHLLHNCRKPKYVIPN